jgi:hypothetical protein
MIWNPESTYTAKIGGLIFRNVTQPIVYGGRSLFSFTRASTTGRLGVSFDLFQQDQAPIASIIHSEVTLYNATDYAVLRGFKRMAVIEKSSGRVWCDIREPHRPAEYELEVSCVLITDTGYPIFLHPDRTKLGIANDDQPPNLASMRLVVPEPGASIGVTVLTSAYLFALAFHNFHTGVSVGVTGANDNVSS